MCSERNVIALTGSMPSDAHCAGVGAKRATRLAWLDTSVSAPVETLGARPSCVITTMTTAATASTATTISACVWREAARTHSWQRDETCSNLETSSLEEAAFCRVYSRHACSE